MCLSQVYPGKQYFSDFLGSPLNLNPTLRPPPSPIYVVLLSVLQLEYIFTFAYKYLKFLRMGKYMKKEKHLL